MPAEPYAVDVASDDAMDAFLHSTLIHKRIYPMPSGWLRYGLKIFVARRRINPRNNPTFEDWIRQLADEIFKSPFAIFQSNARYTAIPKTPNFNKRSR